MLIIQSLPSIHRALDGSEHKKKKELTIFHASSEATLVTLGVYVGYTPKYVLLMTTNNAQQSPTSSLEPSQLDLSVAWVSNVQFRNKMSTLWVSSEKQMKFHLRELSTQLVI